MPKPAEARAEVLAAIVANLDAALELAEQHLATETEPELGLSPRLTEALDVISAQAKQAGAAFTNIITCLAIKATRPQVDVRYHQTQIQDQTDRAAGFNFRGVSEKAVYPWLDRNRLEGAKSGWQTRTLERPKPYKLDYDENIGTVKDAFLSVFDELEEHGQRANAALVHILYRQVVRREQLQITLAVPKIQDISAIIEMFGKHFFRSYAGTKGASRLPVLALHAIYSVMVPELKRYEGRKVLPLNEHSAADSQTGSLGDIEVIDEASQEIFEAVEVKFGMPITEAVAADVQTKIMDKSISRYYILTTHSVCEPDSGAKKIIDNIKSVYDCQVIANGVIATLRYYLRLVSDPSAVFPVYVELLRTDKALAHEHRTAWNDVVKGIT